MTSGGRPALVAVDNGTDTGGLPAGKYQQRVAAWKGRRSRKALPGGWTAKPLPRDDGNYSRFVREGGARRPGDRTRRARALFEKIPKNRLYRIKKEDIRTASGMYSSLMQIYLAYLYSKDARSWPSGRPLKDVLHDGLASDPL